MSSPANAAVYFAADNSIRLVPNTDVPDALRGGGKVAVPMRFGEDLHWIPSDQYMAAYKAGGRADWSATPEHAEGFLHALGSDLVGMVKGLPHLAVSATPLGAAENAAAMSEQDKARAAAGHGMPYRAAAIAATAAGANVPGVEQAAEAGDTGAVLGHATAPVAAMGIAEGLKVAAPTVAAKVPAVVEGSRGKVAGALAGALDATSAVLDHPITGSFSPRLRNVGEMAGKVADLVRPKEAPAAAQSAPATAAQPAAPAAPPAETSIPAGDSSSIPRTMTGEAVLNKALTGLDNKTLLKVARSRGIDVAKEAQLKPGTADPMIIRKIVDDFTPEELDNVRSTGLEVARNRGTHDYANPNSAKEAWHVKVLQTYFPDVRIPQAALNRTQTSRVIADSMAKVAQPEIHVEEMPMIDLLQRSIDAIKKARTNQP